MHVLEPLRRDALERLEWQRLCEILAGEATFAEVAEKLACLTPWQSVDERNRRLDRTREWLWLTDAGVQAGLEPIEFGLFVPYLRRNAVLSGEMFVEIRKVLETALRLDTLGRDLDVEKYPALTSLLATLDVPTSFLRRLRDSFERDGSLLSDASPELRSARDRHDSARLRLVDSLERLIHRTHIREALQDPVWVVRDGKYCLPVRTDRRSQVGGVTRGSSNTGATLFIEPTELAEQQARVEQADTDVRAEEARLLRELSNLAYEFSEEIFGDGQVLQAVDESRACAQIAKRIRGVAPRFECESTGCHRFLLVEAHHPLFLLEDKESISNDFRLERRKDDGGSEHVLVLSGPNAGGKTVAMKIIGLTVLMGKAGLFVPAQEAVIYPFVNVFVEMGDRQSRKDDLSTFSGHLLHVRDILDKAREHTLILMDEGFVGTDPVVGAALARSTLEALANRGAAVVVTTHFSNLKALANEDPRFVNASMEFEASALRPTYHLLMGVPGQSFALELAQRLELQDEIIGRARALCGTESQRLEAVLQEMQEKRNDLDRVLENQRQQRLALEKQLEDARSELASLRHARETLVETYRSRLQKRLNSFSHQLEIKERQFERQQRRDAEVVLLASPPSPPPPAPVSPASPVVPEVAKPPSAPPTQSPFVPKAAESPPPSPRVSRQVSKRTLLDEAHAALEEFRSGLSSMGEDFHGMADKLIDRALHLSNTPSPAVSEDSPQTERTAKFWKAGMRVKTPRFTRAGEIVRAADSKGLVECQFGPVRAKIPVGELQTLEEVAVEKRPTPQKNQRKTKNSGNTLDLEMDSVLQYVDNTLDLRGLQVEEALDSLAAFLDRAYSQDQNYAVIVHGHGTGRVREGVREFLKGCSYKMRYRPGKGGEGGDGVTLIAFE